MTVKLKHPYKTYQKIKLPKKQYNKLYYKMII